LPFFEGSGGATGAAVASRENSTPAIWPLTVRPSTGMRHRNPTGKISFSDLPRALHCSSSASGAIAFSNQKETGLEPVTMTGWR